MKKKVKKAPKYAAGGIAQASNAILMNTFGIDNNSKEGVMLNSTAQGADIGGSIVPGWGHLIGGAAGALMGSFKSGSVDPNTGEITYGGIFGRSSASLRRESNRIKNGIMADAATQNIRADYYNGFAEGGIMRKPVDALVSKGELIYNPTTNKLTKVPGSNGKPNKKDDVAVTLQEGDMVISNSPTMKMANGKTPAQNLEGLVDSNKNIKAKEAIIKKVVNWLEANKTKSNNSHKYALGEDEVLDVKIEPVEINPPVVDNNWNKSTADLLNEINADAYKNISKITSKKPKIKSNDIKGNSRWAAYAQLGLSAAQALNKEKAEPVMYSTPVFKYMPVDVDVTRQLRDIDDSYALSRYNFANLYPSTGAGMAAGLQAAATRAKQYADVRQYQTNERNKLIGQNAGLYNNWLTVHANIMNQVYDKTDANRAAARNINRENMKAFSSNIGGYGRDLAGWDSNVLQTMALQGLGDYAYSNWGSMLKQLKKFGR